MQLKLLFRSCKAKLKGAVIFYQNHLYSYTLLVDDQNVVVKHPVEEETTDVAECPAVDCDVDSLGCERGLKQDEAGCNTCACHICSQVTCLMKCEHGFATDERNCPACPCAECKYIYIIR